MDVNISHLRQHLPEYLARVRQGERVRVTSRGRVVAEILPPGAPPSEAAAVGERLEGNVPGYVDPTGPVLADDDSRMHGQ